MPRFRPEIQLVCTAEARRRRQLKLLVVIDEFTRECLAAEVGRTFTARDVMLTLLYLFAAHGDSGTDPQRQWSIKNHKSDRARLTHSCISGSTSLESQQRAASKRARRIP